MRTTDNYVFFISEDNIPCMTLADSEFVGEYVRTIVADNFSEALILCPEIYMYARKHKMVIGLIIKPLSAPIYTVIDPSLKKLQKAVCGNIEVTSCPDLPGVSIIANEEGKLLKLTLNRGLYQNGVMYDILAGTFLCVSYDENGDINNMTEEMLCRAFDFFKEPEIYLFDTRNTDIIPIKCSLKVAKIMKENNISIIA